MPSISLAPSEQVTICVALSNLLGTALSQGDIKIYCTREISLTLSPDQIRQLITKVEG